MPQQNLKAKLRPSPELQQLGEPQLWANLTYTDFNGENQSIQRKPTVTVLGRADCRCRKKRRLKTSHPHMYWDPPKSCFFNWSTGNSTTLSPAVQPCLSCMDK